MHKTNYHCNKKGHDKVIHTKRQCNRLPDIIHGKGIHFNQLIKERTSVMKGTDEISFFLKWGPIELDLFYL